MRYLIMDMEIRKTPKGGFCRIIKRADALEPDLAGCPVWYEPHMEKFIQLLDGDDGPEWLQVVDRDGNIVA